MKYACYCCGLPLGTGMPPVEALNMDQVVLVGDVADLRERFEILEGTPFAGMSTYSFCGFCLTMIRDFPQAMFDKNKLPGHRMRMRRPNIDYTGMYVWCECGEDHTFSEKNGMDQAVFANRWMVKHGAEIQYPTRNTSNINLFMPY